MLDEGAVDDSHGIGAVGALRAPGLLRPWHLSTVGRAGRPRALGRPTLRAVLRARGPKQGKASGSCWAGRQRRPRRQPTRLGIDSHGQTGARYDTAGRTR